MDHIFFVSLVLAFFSLAATIIPQYNIAYFEQKLDHFNFVQDATFSQRYLYTDQYWNNNGPIFFYTGNEGSITDFWKNSGFVFEAAEQFNALVIFAEHRYYGESLPFGSESFEHDKIGYLAVEQTMADYAVLVTELKVQLNATKNKVVAFGGSYGGELSAYMRFKYPNVIDAALAASAPIYMKTFKGRERQFFFSAVTQDFYKADPDCPGYIVTAFEMLEMLKNQGAKGLSELSRIFKLCKSLDSVEQIHHMLGWIRNAFTTLAMDDYPYPTDSLPGYPVNVVCEMMATASSKLEGLAGATALVYNGTNGTLSCLDPDTEYIECADPTGCGLGPDSLAWDYQVCTELSVPAGSNNRTDMFPVLPSTPEMVAKYCQHKWGVVQRSNWPIIQLWGKDISSASNIIFSNGDLDPWRPGGVLKNVSSTLVAVFVKGGAHHLDLRYFRYNVASPLNLHRLLRKRASHPQDPPTVTEARQQELQLIREFID